MIHVTFLLVVDNTEIVNGKKIITLKEPINLSV